MNEVCIKDHLNTTWNTFLYVFETQLCTSEIHRSIWLRACIGQNPHAALYTIAQGVVQLFLDFCSQNVSTAVLFCVYKAHGARMHGGPLVPKREQWENSRSVRDGKMSASFVDCSNEIQGFEREEKVWSQVKDHPTANRVLFWLFITKSHTTTRFQN